MGNIVETLKWLLIGLVFAVLIAGVIYFTLPNFEDFQSKAVITEDSDYSATIYGVPELDLEHYRLNEDQYFDKLVNGVVYVGRDNPANYPNWYKEDLENYIIEALKELVMGSLSYDEDENLDYDETLKSLNSKISELNPDDSKALLFITWYEGKYGKFDLSKIMTLEEVEKLIKEAKTKDKEGLTEEENTEDEDNEEEKGEGSVDKSENTNDESTDESNGETSDNIDETSDESNVESDESTKTEEVDSDSEYGTTKPESESVEEGSGV